MNTSRFSTRATLLLVSSLTVMAGATIAPALPSMQAHFSGVENISFWVRLVLTLPALLIVMSAPFSGMIVDRWGRLKLLMPSLILYGLAGSSGFYLESLGGILAGRALLGVAVAGVMTSATTLIADYYQGPQRSQFMGWQAAFMSFGGVLFLTAGGGLAEISWRWPFAIYLFSIILIPMALFALPDPDTNENSSQDTAEKSKQLPTKLLGFIYGVGLFGMIIFYLVPIQIPFYLEALVNAGPTASGMAIAVSTLFGMVTSLSYGRIRARMGYLSILALNFGLMGMGYLVIGLADSYVVVVAGLAICGLGMGLMIPNFNVWLTSEVPKSARGRAVGGLTTAIFLGQFLSPLASEPAMHFIDLGMLFHGAGFLLLVFVTLLIVFRQPILSFVMPQVHHAPIKTSSDTIATTPEAE
ncbi:MFS transporter [Aliifodinibius sp. S!AR15-10]|uniref:MFS transporter n=1 Tax=Aliifodinibius sp. S!AR15-10 TaxID=2950437 RepID=UPI00285F1ECE|nr:MFS transporter [Aliifodinibius sp. S!AR15-10]MDR8393763.1 MFS transporter [Aliifodinibius sp. S!AR15-10]